MEVIYATSAVHDFYWSLEIDLQKRADRLVESLRIYKNILHLPHSRALGDGLFELRLNGKHAVRFLYCYVNNTSYILHGLVKKTGALSSRDIEYAHCVRTELLASL
jgi:phage-related protein